MNDLPTQAGYAAYETDPLFGALPSGYDAQQYGSEQHQYGTGQYPEQQYTYDYADTTGQWDGLTPGPYSPAAGQFPDPAAQQYGYDPAHQPAQEPVHEHACAYAYEAAATAAPTPTLGHGLQHEDAYGYYQQQPAPASPGYEPTMQWTVPPEAFADPQAPHDTQAPHDQQTQVQLQVPAYLQQQHQQHPQQDQQGGQGQAQSQAAPEPAPAPYDAGWYASQETVVGPLVVPVAEPDRHQDPQPAPAPRRATDQAAPPNPEAGPEPGPDGVSGHDPDPEPMESVAGRDSEPRTSRVDARANARAAGARSRRRAPVKRSALFTIAVPSACVMGVAGIAAASVNAVGGDDKQDDTATTAAADPASVKPVAANNKMDTQLAALSADARDFGDRASRTQERIDLKERQAADKKKRDEAAARKEAARPKYLLPVKQRGLSAYFGQAGVNWMSVHTGIDFPVTTGTPVMAATDGTVRTQWNSSYGNMAIVTAPDGTETWYCHLSSTRVRSGSVKAGDLIAYSGNTGNTTGPHLHFEVRPGGGAAIDPLPWLRGHGLDPT